MATYRVNVDEWEGYTLGDVVTDPQVSEQDLDVLVAVGVLVATNSTPNTDKEETNGNLSE